MQMWKALNEKSRGDVSPRDYLTKLSLDAQLAGASLLT